jgi:prohibitin 1
MKDSSDSIGTPDGTSEGPSDVPSDGKPVRSKRFPRLRRLYRRVKWLVILTAFIATLYLLRDRIFLRVDTGEVMVVYYSLFGGTQHNRVSREGLHVVAPWDKHFIYVVRSQTMSQSLTVLSKNGLEVNLDAQIRFRPIPEMVPHLHRRFGPDYLNTFVTPQLKGSVQRVVGRFLAEEVYGSETGASISQILESTKQLIGGEFIEIEDVAIFNIKLPDLVQQSIQRKVEAEQNAIAAGFRVDEEREESRQKLVEAEGLQEYANKVKEIPRSVLIWKGIEATQELAKSPNAKIVVVGAKGELPLLIGTTPEMK